MNDFRTEVTIPQSNWQLTVGDKIMSIGSCFSDEVAERLEQRQIQCLSNPYGVVYNPWSLERQIERIVNMTMEYPDVETIQNQGLFHSLMAHSSLSAKTKQELNDNIRHWTGKANVKMKNANMIILTFGTAWVYKYMRFVVANCHKLPADQFDRVRMSVNDVSLSVRNTIRMIRQINEDAQIILTISPIRHLKDTAHGNQISKATLLLGIEDALMRIADNKLSYFPAYEILLDDLRDYRFYAQDMTHPSETAVDYVFQKFSETYFSERLLEYAKEGKALWQLKNHKTSELSQEKDTHIQLVTKKQEEFIKKWGVSIL